MKNKIAKPSPKIEPLPGAVVAHLVRCGRYNCRCMRGDLHGPYFYRYWRDGQRRRKAYVRKAEVQSIRAACATYRSEQQAHRERVQAATAEWRQLKALLKELGL